MSQASQLAPELARGLLQVARALVVAERNWPLYPPEHPTVDVAVQHLASAIRESSRGAVFSFGVAPDNALCAWLRVLTLDLGLDPLPYL